MFPNIIDNVNGRFDKANAYLEKHEEDEDIAEQELCMTTILWTGFALGCATAVGVAILIAAKLGKKH